MPFREVPGAVYCEFKKGDVIIGEDEPLTHVYYLVSGIVKRMTISDDGDKNVLEIKTAMGSVISVIGIFMLYVLPAQYHLVFEAKTDCICYKIKCEEYLNWVHNRPDILEETIKLMVFEFEQMSFSLKSSSKRTTTMQVCGYLLDKVEFDGQKYFIPKQYTNNDIACILGIHKMTLSKIMRALREEAVIQSNRKEIIVLDYPKLQKYALEKGLQYRRKT